MRIEIPVSLFKSDTVGVAYRRHVIQLENVSLVYPNYTSFRQFAIQDLKEQGVKVKFQPYTGVLYESR